MNFVERFAVLGILFVARLFLLEASYQCGIRYHGFLPLINRGWQVEEGHWPWHTGLFHLNEGDVEPKYACGGTLVNEKHVLTAAHCVVKELATNLEPSILYDIELHFGQQNLSKVTDNVVIRDISKAHVHPEYSRHRNDIAVLVMRLAVIYSDYVLPICLDQRVDRDLRGLEGRLGWTTGWGATENGTTSEVLRTASLPVVSYVQCLKDDPSQFGTFLNENVFCAGFRNAEKVFRLQKITGPFNTDCILNPYMFCVASAESDAPKWTGTIAQSENSQTCSSTVVGIVGDEIFEDIDFDASSKNIVVHRVAYYLDWIEKVVWGEEVPSQLTWKKFVAN